MSMKGNYIILEEGLLRDDKIRDLIEVRGFEGLGVYISLLTLIRGYSESDYRIPWNEVRKISRWDLLMPEEELRGFIDSCIACNLFKADDRFFWSDRRRNDLKKQDEVRRKQKEGGKKGAYRRYEQEEE